MTDTTEIRVLRTPQQREYLVPAFSAREAKRVLTERIGNVPLEDLGSLDRHIDTGTETVATQSLIA